MGSYVGKWEKSSEEAGYRQTESSKSI